MWRYIKDFLARHKARRVRVSAWDIRVAANALAQATGRDAGRLYERMLTLGILSGAIR